jgi:hypothetical protein
VQESLYRPAKVSDDFFPYTYKLLSIDPAGGGQNGDETGVAVLFACSTGWIAVMDVTGIPGGTEPRKLDQIVQIAKKWDVHDCVIEKNYGYDAFPNAFEAACADKEWPMSVETVWAQGQKELRIIDALEPVAGFHKLILNAEVLDRDARSIQKYPVEKQALYSFLFQFKHITRERGALIHEDRLESVSQGVTHLLKVIKQSRPDGPPPRPVNKFKQFTKDANGMWKFSHRVGPAAVKHGPIATLTDRFKR